MSALITRLIKNILKLLQRPIDIFKKLLKGVSRTEQRVQWALGLEADNILMFDSKEYPKIKKAKAAINREVRSVLLTPIPSSFSKEIDIEEGDRIEFGIGLKQYLNLKKTLGITFQIELESEDKNKELIFSKSFYPNVLPEDTEWTDIKLDLSNYKGKNKKITFSNKRIDSVNNFEPLRATWSNPSFIKASNIIKYPKKNIILISLDACRPDHLGCYGYKRNASPNLDLLSEKCFLFTNAISQSHWTLPTHMSMFTSLYPTTHKLYLNRRLEPIIKTLPQILRANGYQCFGFVSHLRLSPNYGYSRGFDYYNYMEYDKWKNQATAEDITLKTMNFLNENSHRNNFIFLHYFDIHSPYIPSNKYYLKFNPVYRGKITGREKDLDLFQKPLKDIFAQPLNQIPNRDLEHISALYDGEILHVDEYLGLLFNKLKSLGIYDDSLIIITADHGEELFDHKNMGHNTLYDETIRVPLLIKPPKTHYKSIKKIDKIIQGNIDIFPTILDFSGISIPKNIQGQSLLPLMMPKKYPNYKHINISYSERVSNWNLEEYSIAVRTKKYKYIYTTHFDISNFSNFQKSGEIYELYDLTQDPKEKNNIYDNKPEISSKFQETVDDFVINTKNRIILQEKSILSEKIKKIKGLEKL